MHNLQHRQRLRPFRKLADATMNIFKAHEWNEEDDTSEDGDPEYGAHEVVEDQILGLKRTGRA